MEEGWFKLHRQLFKKAIWLNSTPEQKVILITLLGIANHSGREWEWKGKQFSAEPGMLVTSLESICEKSGKGISIQNVRSALTKFEKYEFLTQEVTKTGRLITIVNWGSYQGYKEEGNKQPNNQLTNNQQSTNKEVTNSQQTGNKEVTTNKNDKNIKNENNDENLREGKEEPEPLAPLSFPTEFHKVIFNTFHEITYRTFFMDCDIEEKGQLITIIVKDAFIKNTIQNRAKELKTLLGKDITVKSKGDEDAC